jgi:hypothetical protein
MKHPVRAPLRAENPGTATPEGPIAASAFTDTAVGNH